MMPITHTLEECKDIIDNEKVNKNLESALANFKDAPLTFSAMSKIGVSDEFIYYLFLVSHKVPDGLKKQLAHYNCQLATEYRKNTALVESQNKTADGHDAAWWTGAFLHLFSGACLLPEIFKRQAAYICQISNGEKPGGEAAE